MFALGKGRLLDEEDIDWWNLPSLLVAGKAEFGLLLSRVASEIKGSAELWATRSGWPANAIAAFKDVPLLTFSGGPFSRLVGPAISYAKVFRRFSFGQIKEIFLDKYDSGYQWRSRLASRPRSCADPVVLVPSAYGNVSRMAAAYARLLPAQNFLLVATRRSASQCELPANVQLRDLASYASVDPPIRETTSIQEKWKVLNADLCSVREFEVLSKAGVFDQFVGWFRNSLRVRNAWREVLDREPVQGVLCGDDSNIYTLLPVLLAARRKIPTVDFHHGAFDGRYLLKELPCDVYLAKNEMERDYLVRVCGLQAERIGIGAPASSYARPAREQDRTKRTSIVFFSEPYEVASMRAEEVYRELLPVLCRVARQTGRDLVIKLHPFESRAQRSRMVRDILSPEDVILVKLQDGPLTADLMAQAWFGITVESTTVIDCLQNGVCCFICGWLTLSPYEYQQQYARFGVGQLLENVEQVSEIPRRVEELQNQLVPPAVLSKAADPAMLRQWLTSGSVERSGVRSAP
jgi:hypothetical protein